MQQLMSTADIELIVSQCSDSTFRDARVLARKAAYSAYCWEKSGSFISIDDIEILMLALELGEKFHGWPGKWANSRFRLLCRKREILNLPEPKTIAQINKHISVDMGCLVFLDRDCELPSSFYQMGSTAYQRARKLGDFFDLSIGGDGRVPVCLRYVDSVEPIINKLEVRRSRSRTPPALVHCESGFLSVSGGGNSAVIDVQSKYVLISCYLLGRGQVRKLICVACDANGRVPELSNNEMDMFT